VRDDMALLIDMGEGTVVITGCGHSGVINIARHAERVTNKPVRAVLGGLHLAGAGEELLEDVVRNVKAKLYAGHCTGLESFAYLRCKADAEPLYVGKVIEF
jgi:7,8-dihydropterin-6-yl-methyl-4-(beta-D-ribofuranosyl)aminobenzene 5'-phosphate synthase